MISYFSGRARSSFDPPETVLRGRRTANKAETTLTKRPMGAPAGRSDTAYRLTCSAQFLVRALGNLVKTRKRILTISLLRRGVRLGLRVLRLGRAGPTSRGREMFTHFHWQPRPNPSSARLLVAASLNMKTYNPRSAWAWQAVIATRFTMSLTEQPRERSLIGAAIPCRIGPMASASAKR